MGNKCLEQKALDCGRVEKRPIGCLGPDVETLSPKVRRVELYKGQDQILEALVQSGVVSILKQILSG